ncbi:MAG: hypothetical protein MASP_00071 [Candidatus Methanolliviera sp. GoM_asphalt]|nr:MAG: hypothetical protein MASP_00071 [Candidatus Methanolliviera sp. GoM_asphalt]
MMKKLIVSVILVGLVLSGMAFAPRMALAGEGDTWTGDVIVIGPDGETIFDDEVTIATTTIVDVDGDKHHFFSPTALGALDEASWSGDFEYEVEEGDYGLWITSIDGYENEGGCGWMYKVDGESAEVGADKYELEGESEVRWYWSGM